MLKLPPVNTETKMPEVKPPNTYQCVVCGSNSNLVLGVEKRENEAILNFLAHRNPDVNHIYLLCMDDIYEYRRVIRND